MKKPVRVGVFDTADAARSAVSGLLEARFAKDEISVICPERMESLFPRAARETAAGGHTTEAATAGGTVGAVLGGLTVAVGLATTGGTGLLLVGPLLATGAVSGGFVGAMVTRGFAREIADFYDQALDKGKILVAVEDEDEERLSRAERALAASGARPVRLPSG